MTDRPERTAAWVYVGSRAQAPDGIHVFALEVDDRRVALSPRSRASSVEHPTFLVPHPTRPVVYAVSETTPGEVVAYLIDAGGTLTEWQRTTSAGDGPCHLSTDGAHVFVANYVSGSAAAHALRADGTFAALVWTAQLAGTGPHPRQDAAHAHCIVRDPHRPSIHVTDLGSDRIHRYEIGTDGFRPAGALTLSPGSGPRHVVFHPHEPVAFVVGELDNKMTVLDVDGDGDLAPRHTVSTLPDGVGHGSLAAAVRLDPAGRHVYVSNRGDDSIAVFAYRNGDVPLTLLGHVPSHGAAPRDIAIDPTGSLLLAANQRSGTVTGFDLRPGGLPRPLGVLASVREPTCIVIAGGVP